MSEMETPHCHCTNLFKLRFNIIHQPIPCYARNANLYPLFPELQNALPIQWSQFRPLPTKTSPTRPITRPTPPASTQPSTWSDPRASTRSRGPNAHVPRGADSCSQAHHPLLLQPRANQPVQLYAHTAHSRICVRELVFQPERFIHERHARAGIEVV
jgi:hypothetical protein